MKHYLNEGEEILKKDDWDANSFQGRTREQYESNAIGAVVSIGGCLLLIVCYLLMKLF
jgi:hypothetical protein|tara:strand:+ start:450 stop:623 length:174 start_codon:yes stop_codon:yes gene_type:complete